MFSFMSKEHVRPSIHHNIKPIVYGSHSSEVGEKKAGIIQNNNTNDSTKLVLLYISTHRAHIQIMQELRIST